MTDDKLEKPELPLVPYDVVHHMVNYDGVINNNPIHGQLDSYNKNKYDLLVKFNAELTGRSEKLFPLTKNDFDEALAHLVPRELNSKGYIKVKDSTITYKELEEAAKNAESVSDKDAAFEKMPRIFIYPEFPTTNIKSTYILNELNKINYIPTFIHRYDDTINMSQSLLNDMTKEEVLAAFTHEYGHRISAADGRVQLNYNLDKHSEIILGKKISDICSDYIKKNNDTFTSIDLERINLLRSKIIEESGSNNCTDKISELNKEYAEIANAMSFAKNMNTTISHHEEYIADMVTALSDKKNARAFANYLKNSDHDDSESHPASSKRVEKIEEIIEDPIEGKRKYEISILINRAIINHYKQYATQPTEATHELKIAPATPILQQNQTQTQPLP